MAAFKLDENLPVEAAILLRSAGHDAVTALEQQMGGKPDGQIAKASLSENRAIITLDLDFADIRVYPPSQHHGIIVLRLGRQDKEIIQSVLRRALDAMKAEPLEGRPWVVGERRIRIRGE